MGVGLWMKGCVIVPALCLVGLSATAQQTGDPVADAARKAREAKKDTTKPKKVYTDDDVKRSAPEPVPVPAAAPGGASGTAAATAVQAAGGAAKTGDAPKVGEAAKNGDATQTQNPNRQTPWRRRCPDPRHTLHKT